MNTLYRCVARSSLCVCDVESQYGDVRQNASHSGSLMAYADSSGPTQGFVQDSHAQLLPVYVELDYNVSRPLI